MSIGTQYVKGATANRQPMANRWPTQCFTAQCPMGRHETTKATKIKHNSTTNRLEATSACRVVCVHIQIRFRSDVDGTAVEAGAE
jgi:hypothetical protein